MDNAIISTHIYSYFHREGAKKVIPFLVINAGFSAAPRVPQGLAIALYIQYFSIQEDKCDNKEYTSFYSLQQDNKHKNE